jgi:serine/tyrosine/threonine adenylyltransferase
MEQNSIGWRLENTFTRLPEVFYTPSRPATFRAPQLSIFNDRLARELGIDFSGQSDEQTAAILSGQAIVEGMQPIAQAYAGHQFGSFTMLGDGRAILLGEQRTPANELKDIQLKGAGRTRYSRGGDGFAALGPMLREYLISEAMAALGIPTTRSLAVVETGETVYRTSALRGAVLTRIAASHLRVGTFQFAAALQNETNLRSLADYTINRHYPKLADASNMYLEFFRAITERQAALIAQWQLVGFIHGIMNTDNMSIAGETIDYGPCAFMNSYNPETVFSSIDRGGRYAYGNQPLIAQWNLARLAETLLPLFDPNLDRAIELAKVELEQFQVTYQAQWLTGMKRKLGLTCDDPSDGELVQDLLTWMQQEKADFTNTFRDLSTDSLDRQDNYRHPEFQAWHARWQQRMERENRPQGEHAALMLASNPAVIPRNHRVEEALTKAEQGDFIPFRQLLDVLREPYREHEGMRSYQQPPSCEEGYQTFCGT